MMRRPVFNRARCHVRQHFRLPVSRPVSCIVLDHTGQRQTVPFRNVLISPKVPWKHCSAWRPKIGKIWSHSRKLTQTRYLKLLEKSVIMRKIIKLFLFLKTVLKRAITFMWNGFSRHRWQRRSKNNKRTTYCNSPNLNLGGNGLRDKFTWSFFP